MPAVSVFHESTRINIMPIVSWTQEKFSQRSIPEVSLLYSTCLIAPNALCQSSHGLRRNSPSFSLFFIPTRYSIEFLLTRRAIIIYAYRGVQRCVQANFSFLFHFLFTFFHSPPCSFLLIHPSFRIRPFSTDFNESVTDEPTDRLTNQPTDGEGLLRRCEDASKQFTLNVIAFPRSPFRKFSQ